MSSQRHLPAVLVHSLAFRHNRLGWYSHVNQVAHTGCGPLGSPLSVIVRKYLIFQGFRDASVRRRSPLFVQVGINRFPSRCLVVLTSPEIWRSAI